MVRFGPVPLPGVCPRSSYILRRELPKKVAQNRFSKGGGEVLVKKIFAPLLVAMSDQAHQLPRSVQCERSRPPLQFNSSFFRRAVAFAVVTRVAARHQVFPRRASPARTRHHVIQRQLGSGEHPRAKLARVPVAQQNILPRKRAALLRNMPVAQEANYRRHLHRILRGVYARRIRFFRLRHALQQQHQRAPHSRHIDGFEGRVQN